MRDFWLYVAAASLACGILYCRAEEAECASCALTPCGSSAECFPGCFCAKEQGEVMGECYAE